MRTAHHKTSDQLQAEALTKSIRAEVKRLKREGTKEEAIKMLQGAGILNKVGKLAKHYRPE
jgi:hypothetical protein